MSPRVGINETAELLVASTASSSALPILDSGELAVTASASSSGLSLSGSAEEALPVSPTGVHVFTEPTLVSWSMLGQNISPTSAKLTVLEGTVTAGAHCTIQFKAEYEGDGAVLLTESTPEQHSPHYAYGYSRASGYMGKWLDLYWRWNSGVESGDWALIGEDLVYLPLDEGDDIIMGGD